MKGSTGTSCRRRSQVYRLAQPGVPGYSDLRAGWRQSAAGAAAGDRVLRTGRPQPACAGTPAQGLGPDRATYPTTYPSPPPSRHGRPRWVRLTAVGGILVAGAFLTQGRLRPTSPVPATAATEVSVRPALAPLHPALTRIVLDPGHGGHDPGARAGALNEAAVVLDVATRLEARLRAETGIEVVLTRRDNVYLPLRARTALANCVGADLFLSIHVNASRHEVAGGIATYHLRAPGSAQTTSARPASFTAGPSTGHESRDLAEAVQRNLLAGVRQLNPDARDMGVKGAKFMVLRGATMPSVLTEISFRTNEREAVLLSTDAYRDQISDALLRSILDYQHTLPLPERASADGND
jgi:N-acetylmuramoyl-L-alanine amidase